MKRLLVILIALPALAGCTDDDSLSWNRSYDVSFQNMSGQILVAWDDTVMAAHLEGVPGLATMQIHHEGQLFTSQYGRGWTVVPSRADDYAGLWATLLDVRALSEIDLDERDAANGRILEGTGSIRVLNDTHDYSIRISAAGARVVDVALDIPSMGLRLTFVEADMAVPFDHGVPANAISPTERDRIDQNASRYHAELARSVQQFVAAGTYPTELTPETLALEDWPDNAVDGGVVSGDGDSANFDWTTCEGGAVYAGYGWDRILTHRVFGTGCI